MVERLFVALWPPADVVASLARLPRTAPEVRWVDPDRWHVTLRFLGHADVDEAGAALARVRSAPVEAVVGPSVRLLGDDVVMVPVTGVEDLAARVTAATADVGRPPDDRPFVGHLTLGRRRRGSATVVGDQRVTARWWITEMALVVSTPADGGARYETAARVPLVDAG